jgi:hypothetical protein
MTNRSKQEIRVPKGGTLGLLPPVTKEKDHLSSAEEKREDVVTFDELPQAVKDLLPAPSDPRFTKEERARMEALIVKHRRTWLTSNDDPGRFGQRERLKLIPEDEESAIESKDAPDSFTAVAMVVNCLEMATMFTEGGMPHMKKPRPIESNVMEGATTNNDDRQLAEDLTADDALNRTASGGRVPGGRQEEASGMPTWHSPCKVKEQHLIRPPVAAECLRDAREARPACRCGIALVYRGHLGLANPSPGQTPQSDVYAPRLCDGADDRNGRGPYTHRCNVQNGIPINSPGRSPRCSGRLNAPGYSSPALRSNSSGIDRTKDPNKRSAGEHGGHSAGRTPDRVASQRVLWPGAAIERPSHPPQYQP